MLYSIISSLSRSSGCLEGGNKTVPLPLHSKGSTGSPSWPHSLRQRNPYKASKPHASRMVLSRRLLCVCAQ